MDANRFDSLTRTLTHPGSRRRALALALGGALAPLLARDPAQGHDTLKKCKKIKDKTKKKKCVKKAKKHKIQHANEAPPPLAPTCTGLDQPCTANAQCCNGICNVGGSTTGPLAGTANECAECRSGRAMCDPTIRGGHCCGPRNCVDADNYGPASAFVCSSLTGEQCIADPQARADNAYQGTCVDHADMCPVTGNAGTAGVCCRVSGGDAPGGCPGTVAGTPEENAACCTGACVQAGNSVNCCAPGNQDPRLSGGEPCSGVDAAPNSSCCSGICGSGANATACAP